MILDPKIQITEVSLQGTLHAIVPTTHNRASARLDRALRQMEREYGLKLTFTPDKPRNEYGDKLKNVTIKFIKPGDCPYGHPKEMGCECKKHKSDDLPKCTASEHRKRIYLESIDSEPKIGHEDNANIWLDITKEENSNLSSRNYNLHCPFCVNQIYFHPIENHGNQLNRFKKYLQKDGPATCKKCQISFKWDFDKNTVIMQNERSE